MLAIVLFVIETPIVEIVLLIPRTIWLVGLVAPVLTLILFAVEVLPIVLPLIVIPPDDAVVVAIP